ncbi:hypothetical protein H7R52_02985 [Weissella confusa]|uniref:Uncharacterized protein n=1 Tax=Weissella confusa TaxID=1583 RepID=A0A923SMQ6_WEICO|nr:hypothetical protein [Weissella confusa]
MEAATKVGYTGAVSGVYSDSGLTTKLGADLSSATFGSSDKTVYVQLTPAAYTYLSSTYGTAAGTTSLTVSNTDADNVINLQYAKNSKLTTVFVDQNGKVISTVPSVELGTAGTNYDVTVTNFDLFLPTGETTINYKDTAGNVIKDATKISTNSGDTLQIVKSGGDTAPTSTAHTFDAPAISGDSNTDPNIEVPVTAAYTYDPSSGKGTLKITTNGTYTATRVFDITSTNEIMSLGFKASDGGQFSQLGLLSNNDGQHAVGFRETDGTGKLLAASADDDSAVFDYEGKTSGNNVVAATSLLGAQNTGSDMTSAKCLTSPRGAGDSLGMLLAPVTPTEIGTQGATGGGLGIDGIKNATFWGFDLYNNTDMGDVTFNNAGDYSTSNGATNGIGSYGGSTRAVFTTLTAGNASGEKGGLAFNKQVDMRGNWTIKFNLNMARYNTEAPAGIIQVETGNNEPRSSVKAKKNASGLTKIGNILFDSRSAEAAAISDVTDANDGNHKHVVTQDKVDSEFVQSRESIEILRILVYTKI